MRLAIAIGVVVTELVLAIALIIVLSLKALAHDAPSGWTYPYACCSDRDCRQAEQDEVRETKSGYRLTSTGEVVEYQSRRIKDSPDGLFHVCQQAGNFDTGRVLCLFVPPRSY